MVKKSLKPLVIPTLYMMLVVLFLLFTFLMSKSFEVALLKNEENMLYVSNEVLMDNVVPVIGTKSESTKLVIKPFTDEKVTVAKNYYDYQDEKDAQEKSIIYYDDTYMQNEGVDYVAENIFNCLAVLDGQVIDINDDDINGKSVMIRHNDELISVYQSLGEVNVTLNDTVSQGDIIGTSGVNKLESDYKNHLHFELVYKNASINPEEYYGKSVGE